jgi:hypothetical protein
VLDQDVLEGAIADVIAELLSPADTIDAARDPLRRDLREVEQEQARLIDAIAAAGDVAALAAALKDREARRASLTRELARSMSDRRRRGSIHAISSSTCGSASPIGARSYRSTLRSRGRS